MVVYTMKRLSIIFAILLVCGIAASFIASGASDTPGDVDLDGTVTAEDALLVLRASAGIDKLNAKQTKLADVTYDGKVNSVACVGEGKIAMGGMISMVDNMNRILDLVGLYLA